MLTPDAQRREAIDPKDDTPAARMARRWPQKVTVAALIGLPVNDDRDRTLGIVRQVVRAADGSIRLIVAYNRTFAWFGWFTRPVAIPIEVVALYGRQLASLDMQPDAWRAAPDWVAGTERPLPPEEVIRVALTKR